MFCGPLHSGELQSRITTCAREIIVIIGNRGRLVSPPVASSGTANMRNRLNQQKAVIYGCLYQ